jgi:endonuclease/exonuclease/phosphatase family metal-dependent hydrolase
MSQPPGGSTQEHRGERVTVASLNTRGMALTGSSMTERYRAIAQAFEASDVDVVSFQEVLTYYHLNHLTRHMPSFRQVSYRPSFAGPAGGVVTLSRLPVASCRYRRFSFPPSLSDLPRFTRFKAPLKGTLVTQLAQPDLGILTTHTLANIDGEWSPSNRFYRLQQGQLADVAGIVRAGSGHLVVCGDFNIARDSTLYQDFIAKTGLIDTFDGRCPPTFHAEYLSPDRSPRCIDFILTTNSIQTAHAEVLFTDKQPLSGGPAYLSDHVGLGATLVVAAASSDFPCD